MAYSLLYPQMHRPYMTNIVEKDVKSQVIYYSPIQEKTLIILYVG